MLRGMEGMSLKTIFSYSHIKQPGKLVQIFHFLRKLKNKVKVNFILTPIQIISISKFTTCKNECLYSSGISQMSMCLTKRYKINIFNSVGFMQKKLINPFPSFCKLLEKFCFSLSALYPTQWLNIFDHLPSSREYSGPGLELCKNSLKLYFYFLYKIKNQSNFLRSEKFMKLLIKMRFQSFYTFLLHWKLIFVRLII